jgi:hypothetical protein
MSKKFAVIFGVVFVIVGIMGFFGNPIVGRVENNPIFVTDALHDLVHIIIGVVLVIAGTKSMSAAGTALKVFGVVYLLLAIDGFFQPDSLLGFVTANSADTWLHLVLGIVLLAVGLMGGKSSEPMMMNTGSTM